MPACRWEVVNEFLVLPCWCVQLLLSLLNGLNLNPRVFAPLPLCLSPPSHLRGSEQVVPWGSATYQGQTTTVTHLSYFYNERSKFGTNFVLVLFIKCVRSKFHSKYLSKSKKKETAFYIILKSLNYWFEWTEKSENFSNLKEILLNVVIKSSMNKIFNVMLQHVHAISFDIRIVEAYMILKEGIFKEHIASSVLQPLARGLLHKVLLIAEAAFLCQEFLMQLCWQSCCDFCETRRYRLEDFLMSLGVVVIFYQISQL